MSFKFWLASARCLAALSLIGLAASCGGGGGGDSEPDVGDNDINKVLCVGDSITDGGCAPAGAPYPARLGGFAGKSTINEGICGSTSGTGAERMNSLLSRFKPGYVCILYGANDIGFGRSIQSIENNLRFMVQAAKANQSVAIIATMYETYDSHKFLSGGIRDLNERIRAIAKEEGARLVDLQAEFGTERTFIQPDGLHPSDSGTELIALSFNDRI
jgi:lysophospholipase L1-like esterase